MGLTFCVLAFPTPILIGRSGLLPVPELKMHHPQFFHWTIYGDYGKILQVYLKYIRATSSSPVIVGMQLAPVVAAFVAASLPRDA
jgi:hypothetical protein